MRYISAPHRSHGTLSSGALVVILMGVMGLTGGRAGVCSDMRGIIARTSCTGRLTSFEPPFAEMSQFCSGRAYSPQMTANEGTFGLQQNLMTSAVL